MLHKVQKESLRTKNLEYNLLILELLLEYYEKTHAIEIKRSELLDISDTRALKYNKERSSIGHSTFKRVLTEMEQEMVLRVKKIGKRQKVIAFNIDRVKKMINDIKYKQGFYRPGVKIKAEQLDSTALKELFQQIATSIQGNYHNPWISRLDEKAQYAHLTAERCASKIAAILMTSRFSFTLAEGSSLQSIDNAYLAQALALASKIASKDLGTPFSLLIEYSGLPQSNDWGKLWNKDVWQAITPHFEIFAQKAFKFELNPGDLTNLELGLFDDLSPKARKLFNVFLEDYLLPSITSIGSKNIKFSDAQMN